MTGAAASAGFRGSTPWGTAWCGAVLGLVLAVAWFAPATWLVGALFTLTEGRAYSAAEYRAMLLDAGLTPSAVAPTAVHCGVIAGRREV